MKRIKEAFSKLGETSALIPFIVAGDPDYDASVEMAKTILDAGADMLEIGFPYSDPLADGPVIQASAVRSLHSGFVFPDGLKMISDLRAETDKPLVAFTYVNPILQYGIEAFFEQLRAAGGDGAIVPDVPLEEAEELAKVAAANDIALIPLVAPTSGRNRIERICEHASGFVYCVSSLGVTGERTSVADAVKTLVDTVKSFTTLPACVGFGVSLPEHAREISAYADGVIVGSAYVRRIAEMANSDMTKVKSEVAAFTKALKSSCN